MGIKPNSGAAIQGIATAFMWIGIVGSVILAILAGFALGSVNEGLGFLSALVVAGIGCLLSWLSTRLLQGFGELVQYTAETASYLKVLAAAQQPAKPLYPTASTAASTPLKPSTGFSWHCEKCGLDNEGNISICKYCGTRRPYCGTRRN